MFSSVAVKLNQHWVYLFLCLRLDAFLFFICAPNLFSAKGTSPCETEWNNFDKYLSSFKNIFRV